MYLCCNRLANSSQDLKVKVSSVPLDENSSSSAFLISDSGQTTAYIQQKAAILTAHTIVADTVSTGQTFSYTVHGEFSSNLIDARAILQLPASFNSTVLEATFNDQNQATWSSIPVPSTAEYTGTASETLKVLIKGTDMNTGKTVWSGSPILDTLTVQLKPKLYMKGEVVAPAYAKSSGILTYGQIVTIDVWPGLVYQQSGLEYAGIEGSGTIILNNNLFTADKFVAVEGEEYEKTFAAIGQKVTFKVRAPVGDRTASINFRIRNLPLDKNSRLAADVDVDSGTVSIPIRVRHKEITVTVLDSLITNTIFARGAGSNLLLAFRISNVGSQDPLTLKGVELTFINNNDTSALSAQTLINMLDSVQVINYSQYLTLLGQDPGDDQPAAAGFRRL